MKSVSETGGNSPATALFESLEESISEFRCILNISVLSRRDHYEQTIPLALLRRLLPDAPCFDATCFDAPRRLGLKGGGGAMVFFEGLLRPRGNEKVQTPPRKRNGAKLSVQRLQEGLGRRCYPHPRLGGRRIV